METRSPHEFVAAEVRAHLARRRISGRAAARTLGWSSDYIHRRLDGRTAFDVNDIMALAALLEVPVQALFPQMIMEPEDSPLGSNKIVYSPLRTSRLLYLARVDASSSRPQAVTYGLTA